MRVNYDDDSAYKDESSDKDPNLTITPTIRQCHTPRGLGKIRMMN